MAAPKIALLMGSKNDLPKLQSCIDTINEFGIPLTVRVMSAHRTPAQVMEFTETAADNGIQVILAAAGMAAHLAGVVSAHTILPVIGIPVEGGPLKGLDALYSTVQMPGGIPVGTVGIGKGGVKNAALLALQIVALSDKSLAEKLRTFRKEQGEAVIKADEELQASL